MTRIRSATLLALAAAVVLALVAAPVPPVQADDPRDHDRARSALQAGEILSLRSVLDRAESQFTGDMIEAELEREGPLWVYDITLLAPDGSLLKLGYDATSGQLLQARGHEVARWFRGPPEDLPDRGTARRMMHERFHEKWEREGDRPPLFLRWWRERREHEYGEDRGKQD